MTPELEQGLAILAQLGAAIDNASPAARRPPSDALLHVAEARYRALVEQIPAVTFMASLDGGLHEVYVSPQIEGLLGFAQEEWMSNPVLWFRRFIRTTSISGSRSSRAAAAPVGLSAPSAASSPTTAVSSGSTARRGSSATS